MFGGTQWDACSLSTRFAKLIGMAAMWRGNSFGVAFGLFRNQDNMKFSNEV